MSAPTLKILLSGHHPGLLHTLEESAARLLSAEVIPLNSQNLATNSLRNIGMVMVLHHPPAVDGLSHLSECKRLFPTTPIIVATSDTSFQTTNRIWRSGVQDVLPFPGSDEQFQHCFEEHFGGHSLTISVRFFGSFGICINGKPICLTKQAEQIFAYLVYHHGSRSLNREELGQVFWPDKYEICPDGTRRSLNVEITKIRKSLREQTGLNSDFIIHQNQRYQIDPALTLGSDIAEFRDLLAGNHGNTPDVFPEIVRLYNGVFMGNFAAHPDCWIQKERQRLNSMFKEYALRYCEETYQRGDYNRTASVCREILEHDASLEFIKDRLQSCYQHLGIGGR
ncbi:MAG: winged helix-turn-helix domain-containing protein [Saprospiraceae bacterium]|nr:winged helix-turn-helix domain-containing protein [Saprospiraceae bacterium]